MSTRMPYQVTFTLSTGAPISFDVADPGRAIQFMERSGGVFLHKDSDEFITRVCRRHVMVMTTKILR